MNPNDPIVIVAKRNKSNRISETDGCSRSLNDFHDSILKHILSFLSTKVAVRTSVLSKRWEYMWTSLPNLDFQYNEYKKKKDQFMDFVDRALILHNEPKIHKFSLDCRLIEEFSVEDVSDLSRINNWISGAVRHNAEEFYISFQDDDENAKYMFPFCLFKCETMEVLKLHAYISVQLPSQIYLPRLKILSLYGMKFKDYHQTNLLFASPALEQLEIEDCSWREHKSSLVISAPKLWMLTIMEPDHQAWSEYLASSSVTISAPQLKKFKYGGGLIQDYRVTHSSTIIKATLMFHCYVIELTEMPIDHFDEFLRSLQLVKDLQLCSAYFEVLSNATIPMFKNLTLLEILGPVDLSCEEFGMFLNKCPCLKTLKLPLGIFFDSETYNFQRLLNLKFVYLPLTLKNIMIGCFRGSIENILAVQILLAQMTSLESMEIILNCKYVRKRKEFKTVMSALPRGSKSCVLNIR